MDEKRYFTTRELADRLVVTRQTVQKWTQSGELKACVKGKGNVANVYDEDEVMRFLVTKPKLRRIFALTCDTFEN